MKKIMMALVLGMCSVGAQAQTVGQHILIDGSVARCIDMSDYGSRVFKLKATEVSKETLKLELDNLVCVLNEAKDKMILVPYALSRPFEYNKDGRKLSYEYTKANIVVLNTEATALLQTIAINPHVSSQEITVNIGQLNVKTFDLSLQPLEVIKLDGEVLDQGMVFSGSYRIKIK